ncbi:MAG: 3-methyladenine DNA glycosylase [Acidimicrobiia bacterium]|nr:MAG: 3-methyladenine DNA glycosylase [Acidimicrobiia bacterium]
MDGAGTWWWATRTPAGAATVALDQHPDGVLARAWGQGAGAIVDRVPRLVGSDHAYEVRAHEQRMRDILARTRGLRLGSTADVHGSVVGAVLGQVVTRKEGKRSLRCIMRAYGEPAPGPNSGLTMFPTPEVLSSLSYEELHRHGVERRRAATVIEVSRRSKRLTEILSMKHDEAEERLLAVRGVGPWTAAIVMGQAYGDRDAVPTGDYHLPNTVAWALAGEARGDDDRMLELLEPYRPFRRYVVTAIKQSGIKAPKYGPRTALRRHL